MRKLFTSFLLLAFVFGLNAQNETRETTTANTSGTLTVSTTTVTYNGDYSPKHYLAIWITNSAGTYVKTLYGCTGKHPEDLTNWIAANPTIDKTDATTGATLSSHATRTVTWNGTNVSKTVVADGDYIVKLEMTENEYTGKLATYTFTKGTTAVTLNPANVSGFSNISIKWVPTNTALNDIQDAKQYSVYPNPTLSTAYVNGYDIQEIELIALNGKSIFVTQNPKLDLNLLPKGIYLAKITAQSGTYMKKIEKL